MLPYHSQLVWWRSGGIPTVLRTFSSMRRFAWWPTKWKRLPSHSNISRSRVSPCTMRLIPNIWTARPSWRKCPPRGISTFSRAAGLLATSFASTSARPGWRVETTAAAAASPQSTADARSL